MLTLRDLPGPSNEVEHAISGLTDGSGRQRLHPDLPYLLVFEQRQYSAAFRYFHGGGRHPLPVIRSAVVVVPSLVGVPNMIKKMRVVQLVLDAGVDEPGGHFIRAADMAEVIIVLVRTADHNEVLPSGAQAGTVVVYMPQVPVFLETLCRLRKSDGDSIDRVHATRPDDLVYRRIIEGVKALVEITYLLEVQRQAAALLEFTDHLFDERRPHDGVGIHHNHNAARGIEDANVVHPVLMIVLPARRVHHDPGIHLRRKTDVFVPAHHRVYLGRPPVVVLDPDDLIPAAVKPLVIEVLKRMKAFTHRPIQQYQADFRPA